MTDAQAFHRGMRFSLLINEWDHLISLARSDERVNDVTCDFVEMNPFE